MNDHFPATPGVYPHLMIGGRPVDWTGRPFVAPVKEPAHESPQAPPAEPARPAPYDTDDDGA